MELTPQPSALAELAALLAERDRIDANVARLTGRSARPGDVGEFIAAQVFEIDLAPTAVQAGYDGRADLEAARIYPDPALIPVYPLTGEQQKLLACSAERDRRCIQQRRCASQG